MIANGKPARCILCIAAELHEGVLAGRKRESRIERMLLYDGQAILAKGFVGDVSSLTLVERVLSNLNGGGGMVFGNKKKARAKKNDAAADNTANESGTSEETEVGEPSVEFVPAAKNPDALTPSADGGTPVAATTVAGPPAEEVFVDGVAGLSFRSGVVKLDWYSVVSHDREKNSEVRKAAHRLVMPVTALQELLQLLQNASAELLGLDVKVQRARSEGSGPGNDG